jgi:predicted MFS family arabinose efflux permease
MGAYTAFIDLSIGITSPLLGLIAGQAGLRSVFLVSAAVVLCAAVVATRLVFASSRERKDQCPTSS